MRFAVFAAALFALPSVASAADYGLPPPPEEYEAAPVQFNWGGIYGGIHAGYANTDFKLEPLAQALAGSAYYAATALEVATSFARIDNSSNAGPAYGAFIGYNWDWDGAVIGLEADFTAFSGMSGYGAMPWDGRRKIIDGIDYTVASEGDADAELKHLTLLKLRGGVPIGTFMPYGTVGLAIGYQSLRANYYSDFVERKLDDDGYPAGVIAYGSKNAAIDKSGYTAGLALGAGIDWAVLPNLLLRAEYQYVAFSSFKGMETNVNMVRAGVGFKY
jgi:outer membrane immunogenic protein